MGFNPGLPPGRKKKVRGINIDVDLDGLFEKADDLFDSAGNAMDKAFESMDDLFEEVKNSGKGKITITSRQSTRRPKRTSSVNTDFATTRQRIRTIQDMVDDKARKQTKKARQFHDKFDHPPKPIVPNKIDKFVFKMAKKIEELNDANWSDFKFVKCLKPFIKTGQWAPKYVEPKEKKWFQK